MSVAAEVYGPPGGLRFSSGLQGQVTVNWGPDNIDQMRHELAIDPTILSNILTSARLGMGPDDENADGPQRP